MTWSRVGENWVAGKFAEGLPPRYTINILGENAAGRAVGWGVMVDGVQVCAKPSKHPRLQMTSGHALYFNKVRDAKSYCERHANREGT